MCHREGEIVQISEQCLIRTIEFDCVPWRMVVGHVWTEDKEIENFRDRTSCSSVARLMLSSRENPSVEGTDHFL